MEHEITLDNLSTTSVSIKTMNYTIIDGVKYYLGEPHRKAYVNSINGRASIVSELAEPYLYSVMSLWGNEPTVTELAEN